MSAKHLIASFISILCAVSLLVALAFLTDIDLINIWNQVSSFSFPAFFFVIILSLSIMLLSQERWQTLQKHYITTSALNRSSTFFYTCIGASLSQVIPAHFSTSIARSIGSWIENRSGQYHSIAFTIIEQLFDLIISLGMLAPCLLFLMGIITPLELLFITLILVIILALSVLAVSAKFPNIGSIVTNAIPFIHRVLSKKAGVLVGKLQIPPTVVCKKLYLLSMLKYASLTIRACIIGYVAIPEMSYWKLSSTIPVMQLSGILPITPGSLGITEWAWSSAITLLGIALSRAAEFVIIHRIITLFAQFIITSISVVVYIAIGKK